MVIDSEKVISLIDEGVSERIKAARKQADKLNMHMTGKKLKDYLEDLDSYENNAQKLLREKLVKSNRAVFSFLLRPLDKVFTAKGGSVQYNLEGKQIEQFKNEISELADGLDIKKYLKKVVRRIYIQDPNAVLFIDIDKRGQLETHVIKTEEILWYENRGNSVEAIIFAPYQKEEDKGTDREGQYYYRVIDEKTDRIFVQKGDEIWEDEKERLSNYFGFVPAMILGDEKSINENIYESIVSDILEEADELLRDISVKTVHKLAHAYPRYWSYEQACTRCQGEGQIPDPKDETKLVECPSCAGEGIKTRTNPSDELSLRAPGPDEPVLAPNIAGYVSPDLETAEFYERQVEKAKNVMFHAMWGTTYEPGGKKETATGRYIDAQPVQDRLKDISGTFARFHKFMLDCYGRVILKNPKYRSAVSYGTRYIMETPDDILKTYTEATRDNVSELVLIDLRNKYIEAEYQGDNVELMKRRKLANVEPFPTMKIADVMAIEGLPAKEKLKKMYFSAWVSQLKEAQIIFYTEDQLRGELDKYVSGKSLEPAPEPQPNPIINQN